MAALDGKPVMMGPKFAKEVSALVRKGRGKDLTNGRRRYPNISPDSVWVKITGAYGGGGKYIGSLLKFSPDAIPHTGNLSEENIGESVANCMVLNLKEIGKDTHKLLYNALEEDRYFIGQIIKDGGDDGLVVAVDGTCCDGTCCNTICFTIYNGEDEETDEPIYIRVTFTDDGTGVFSSSDGFSTLTKVGSDWVVVIHDMDTWTAPADADGCVSVVVDDWEQTGSTGFLQEIKCGSCEVEDCCESYCVTTDFEEDAQRVQLPVETPGISWVSGDDSLKRVDSNWVLIVRGAEYHSPVEGNSCPPTDVESWTLIDGDDVLESIVCEECGTLYRQARICGGDEDLVDKWMTVANATTVGAQIFKTADGQCYFFSDADHPRLTPGTIVEIGDVTLHADCTACATTPPCCEKYCIVTLTDSYELTLTGTKSYTGGGMTMEWDGSNWKITTPEGSIYIATGSYGDCPPTATEEAVDGVWTLQDDGADVLVSVACGACPPEICETCPGADIPACPEHKTLTVAGLVDSCAFLNNTYTLSKNGGGGYFVIIPAGPNPGDGPITIGLTCGNLGDCAETCESGNVWILQISFTIPTVGVYTIRFVACGPYCCPPDGAYLEADCGDKPCTYGFDLDVNIS